MLTPRFATFQINISKLESAQFLAERSIAVPTLGGYTLVQSSPRWRRATKFEQLAVERVLDDG
jgi:hypothetical protein